MVTFDKNGHMVIVTNTPCSKDEWYYRVQALITFIGNSEIDEVKRGQVYWLMSMLDDLMPSESQFGELAKKPLS
jgi:hypothetical protein